jgi:C-terminal processing protease CtpA/Prc
MATMWHGPAAPAAREGSPRHGLFIIPLVLWAVFCSSAAVAETPPVEKWFVELDHAEADVRESARINLMGLDRQGLDVLRQIVEENRPLRPSQAAVLREIVAQAYLAGEPYESQPAGFLGVTLSDVLLTAGDARAPGLTQESGVVIINRVPGFVANRLLMDGDVVLGVDGQPVVRMQDLQFRISNLASGSTVALRVLRAGAVVDVPVRLDARPLRLEQVDVLRQMRDRQFNDYWQRTFAPLLQERLSLSPHLCGMLAGA